MKSFVVVSFFAALLPLAAGDPPKEAIVFTAVTKVGGSKARLLALLDATVRGWVDGDRGRVEFLESRNGAWPAGSILWTGDGGRTVRFYDLEDRKCRAWVPIGGAPAFPQPPAGTPAAPENLRVEKALDEPGPEMLGFATRHYRFRVAYDTAVGGASSPRRLHTESVEELWTAPELTDAALSMWLSTRASRGGSASFEEKLGAAMADVYGAPLKRVIVARTELEGRAPQAITTTTEVTQLRREPLDAAMLREPFPCKILKPEDRR